MTNGSEHDLRRAVSVNLGRDKLSAWAIVGGLVFETVVLLYFSPDKSPWETALLILSNLVIASGVWGEIHFGGKASDAAERLQQISDQKIAEANARAAEANQKAQEASLQLAKFRAPRTLEPEQKERIAAALKQFPGVEYDIQLNSNDPEFLIFTRFIETTLATAGWVEIDWSGLGQVLHRNPGQRIIGVGSSATNVVVGIYPEVWAKLAAPAAAFIAALADVGIDVFGGTLAQTPGMSANVNAVHIMIGRKT